MPWAILLPILQLIWSASSPLLKSAALVELKKLEVEEANRPFLLAIIKDAETLLSV